MLPIRNVSGEPACVVWAPDLPWNGVVKDCGGSHKFEDRLRRVQEGVDIDEEDVRLRASI